MLTPHSTAGISPTVGFISGSRGRVRMWIEEYLPDGDRSNISAAEMNNDEISAIIKFLQNQIG